MMYIMMQNPGMGKKILQVEWHIGEPMPAPLNAHNKHLVVAVEADGDELTAISSGTSNFPYSKKPVQTWRGELAQFIVDNIVDVWKPRT
jgi:TRAP-type uncharacterized transport system substrate-binding protein